MTSLGHLRMTAVGGESEGETEALASQLNMVRAALLYADEVTYCTQDPEMIAWRRYLRILDHPEDLARVPRQQGSWRAGMEELVAVADGSMTAAEAIRLEEMKDIFAIVDPAELLAASRRLKVDMADLRALEESGLVTVIQPSSGWPLGEDGGHILDVLDEILVEAAAGGTAPLLDAAAWEYVSTVSPDSGAGPAIDHASVAGRMVAEVEGYADAPLDALVDVRDDLRPYLAAFRAAILRFSDRLPPSSDPGLRPSCADSTPARSNRSWRSFRRRCGEAARGPPWRGSRSAPPRSPRAPSRSSPASPTGPR